MSQAMSDRATDTKIVVIHTGGTIAMTSGAHGLSPGAGTLETTAALRRLGSRAVVHTLSPLTDSASIGPSDWNAMLDLIAACPGRSVLVTHGTDTMAFTGAALSRALVGTGRRVILCGAMSPVGSGSGEAEANLELAVAALQADTPGAGVWFAFDGQLLDAAGLVKHHSTARGAFRSVVQNPMPTPLRRRFDARRLAIVSLSPGLPAAALRAMLDELDGAVLRVFGAGTIMDDPELVAVLRAAVRAGKPLRAVSQCEAGGLAQGAYAAGRALWEAGVTNGGYETPESALMYLWLMD